VCWRHAKHRHCLNGTDDEAPPLLSSCRNLLCVHSKKHINDIPELAEQKLASNRRTLKEMAKLFK